MDILIRYFRIIKHLFVFILSFDIKHKYEVEHYFYMKKFKKTL